MDTLAAAHGSQGSTGTRFIAGFGLPGGWPLFIVLCILASGCSTHRVPLGYTRAPAADFIGPRVGVGTFQDDRGTAPNWLGAIRGGYGNALKKLHTEQPMNQVLEQVFRDALRARDMLDVAEAPDFELSGSIQKLDCSYYIRREAHVHLSVTLHHRPSGTEVFSSEYRADRIRNGWGAGIFGSVEGLRAIAEGALEDVVDYALADRALLKALGVARIRADATATERLQQLESLRVQGLISDGEFQEKRGDILGGP